MYKIVFITLVLKVSDSNQTCLLKEALKIFQMKLFSALYSSITDIQGLSRKYLSMKHRNIY